MVVEPVAAPRTRSEAELRGYSNAQTYVFDEAAREPHWTVRVSLHLHRMLYEPTGAVGAGQFKTADNLVVERRPDGERMAPFRPVSAARTPQAMSELVDSYNDSVDRGTHDPLLLICGAVLDFSVIHPFADGNGRVSRLLFNLLLAQAGFDVGRYVSLERVIEQNKERYYDVLLASTHGWQEGSHTVWPAVSYMVQVIEQCYTRFVQFADVERAVGSKRERVRRFLDEYGTRSFSMAELTRALPGVSQATIRLVLNEMRNQGTVIASSGRGARWQWVTHTAE
jgi:Fic family protein